MVFRSFAVIGAGHMGNFIIEELLRLKTIGVVSSVTVVSRSDARASHPGWAKQGAKFATIDYNDRPTLLAAFKGVEVVISTVSSAPGAVQSQTVLADAAKEVGVKIFAPSEFGGITLSPSAPLRINIHDYLEEIGLPYVIFYTGAWTDRIFSPAYGYDFVNGKVTVLGIGDAEISFLSRPDIARYVGFIFTNLPTEKFEWKVFRLEADRGSFNGILRSYQEKTGKTLQITHVPPSELEKRTDSTSIIALRRDRGQGLVGEPLDNDLYPGWNPIKVLEHLL